MNNLTDIIAAISDFVCGYPLFLTLIGGGLFLFIRSRAISFRMLGSSVRALRDSMNSKGGDSGQITSIQALMSSVASTVGMGNIAGVAIALVVGGPGAIFWMWVSALVGMSTKFFEGTLSIMYKGKDREGQTQGGMMYIITSAFGEKWRPMAQFFTVAALVGTLAVMQSNQLVESITTVITSPLGIPDTWMLRTGLGIAIAASVGAVVLGGIERISVIASRIVPVMVCSYFVVVAVILVLNIKDVPAVFASIVSNAFNLKAGLGAFMGVALTGARRAAYVNEAGVGTASMMHGASSNTEPLREGFIAMLAPAIDSGLVCTLTSLPILLAGNYADAEGVKGLTIALGAFGKLLPGIGQYLLMIMVFCFAFSTMFSYSYYGQKCSNFLFGSKYIKVYNWFYIVSLVIAAVIPLGVAVSIMDLAFALMAFPTMFTLIRLSPKVLAMLKK